MPNIRPTNNKDNNDDDGGGGGGGGGGGSDSDKNSPQKNVRKNSSNTSLDKDDVKKIKSVGKFDLKNIFKSPNKSARKIKLRKTDSYEKLYKDKYTEIDKAQMNSELTDDSSQDKSSKSSIPINNIDNNDSIPIIKRINIFKGPRNAILIEKLTSNRSDNKSINERSSIDNVLHNNKKNKNKTKKKSNDERLDDLIEKILKKNKNSNEQKCMNENNIESYVYINNSYRVKVIKKEKSNCDNNVIKDLIEFDHYNIDCDKEKEIPIDLNDFDSGPLKFLKDTIDLVADNKFETNEKNVITSYKIQRIKQKIKVDNDENENDDDVQLIENSNEPSNNDYMIKFKNDSILNQSNLIEFNQLVEQLYDVFESQSIGPFIRASFESISNDINNANYLIANKADESSQVSPLSLTKKSRTSKQSSTDSSNESPVCVFCKLSANQQYVGYLHGPYSNEITSDQAVWLHLECYYWSNVPSSTPFQPITTESWPFICDIDNRYCGHCNKSGATITCGIIDCDNQNKNHHQTLSPKDDRRESLRTFYHYPCARQLNFQFDDKNYKIFCYAHSNNEHEAAKNSN